MQRWEAVDVIVVFGCKTSVSTFVEDSHIPGIVLDSLLNCELLEIVQRVCIASPEQIQNHFSMFADLGSRWYADGGRGGDWWNLVHVSKR